MTAAVLPFTLKGTKSELVARDVARYLLGLGSKPEGLTESEGEYIWQLKRRAAAGVLPSGVEQMLWHYAYGKPTETIEATIKRDPLHEMSDAQLADYIDSLLVRLRKLQGVA